MTKRSKKGPTPKRTEAQPPTRRRLPGGALLLVLIVSGLVAVFVVGLALFRDDGGDRGGLVGLPTSDPGPVHVHGLGINPSDGALFIATHTGLWRVGKDQNRAARVTDRRQDTMGFTVVGRDLFLGSGHPDLRDGLPPLLGLIESRDGGKTWETVSLLGEADFHVLRSRGKRVYGFDSSNGRLMLSRDSGRSWAERPPPGALLDLAVNPSELSHLVASGERGLLQSFDEGRTWRALGQQVGLLAWPSRKQLYIVDQFGGVGTSADGGVTWRSVGDVGGQPAALMARGRQELYVALHDGTVKRSTDGGRTWTIRASPA